MSALEIEAEVTGFQRPRLVSLPPAYSYAQGEDAVEYATRHGLILDDWQEWALVQSMATMQDGSWAAFEVCWIVPRQNGKNGILIARELAGLFVIREPLIIHTAHEFKASREHFRKVREIIETDDELMKRVKRNGICTSHGEEAIELKSEPTLILGSSGRLITRRIGPRLRFLARSRGSGRSFTCDCLVYDESMILSEAEVGASLPTLSAVPNPQVWYTASAGMKDSTQLGSVRNRGIAGADPDLVFGEWSINPHNDYCPKDATGRIVCDQHDDRDDPRSAARANPSLNGPHNPESTNPGITLRHVRKELTKMPATEFDRERLGVGDWPLGTDAWLVMPQAVWESCTISPDDMPAARPNRIVVALDVALDGSAASIMIGSVVQVGGQERILVERGVNEAGWEDHRAGTDWVIPRLKELKLRWRVAAWVVDPISPGAALLATAMEKAGFEVTKLAYRDAAESHMRFCNWAREIPADPVKGTEAQPRKLAHFNQDDVSKAVAAADRREMGDGQYVWSRKHSTVDTSPVTAGSMAAWGADKFGRGYDILNSVR